MDDTPKEGFEDVRLSADNAFAQISAKREALDKAGRANETLFVLLGEEHTTLFHKLHHLALLERVRQNFQDFALSFEMPHDYAYQDSNDLAHYKLSQSERGEENLSKTIEKFKPLFACYANDVLNKYSLSTAQSSALKCAYTDASWRFDDYQLNPNDLSTFSSIKACGYKAEQINGASPAGMHIRNHHMHKSLTNFSRDSGALLAIHICGAAHVNGLRGQFSHAKGLASFFRSKSQPFLAAFYEGGAYGSDKGLRSGEILSLSNLQGPTAIYDACNVHVAHNRGSDFADFNQEKAYFDTALNALGLGHLAQDKLGL